MFSQASNISDRFLTFDIFAHYGPKCNFFLIIFYWRVKYLLLTAQMQSFAHCVCARVCERGRHGHITTAACLQTSVCHTTLFPSLAWTDGKTKDIINCLYIYFES